MKFYKYNFLFILPVAVVCCISCRKGPEELDLQGEVQFGMSFVSNGTGRSENEADPTKLIVSLENSEGEEVLIDEEIPLQQFNSNFISDPITLPADVYHLTKFWVMVDDSVIYLTPLEDSELAYLVEEPLPISFTVAADEVATVNPEVLSASEGNAPDFGFSEFGFNVIRTFDLLLGVLVYDTSQEGHDFTSASITISSGEDVVLERELVANVNKLTLRDASLTYDITISKEGYPTYEQEFTTDSLKNYQGTDVNGVLRITLGEQDVTSGLIAYFPFDGDAMDMSGNGHNGSVIGATLTQDKGGNENSAYAFGANNDYIEITNHSDFENQNYSISLWFKSGNGDGALVSMSDFSPIQNNSGYYLSILDSQLRGLHNISTGTSGWVRNNDDEVLNLNEWHHVVQTYDGSELKLFINGNLAGSVTDTNAINYSEHNPILIGSYALQDGSAFDFEGAIDEVRIYNRSLSESEISILNGL